jgi:HEAT repeat protein
VGVVAALTLFPTALILGSAALASGLWDQFTVTTVLKGADNLLRYGLYATTAEMLYLALPAASRARAKSLVEGVFQPAAGAIAGALASLFVTSFKLAPAQLGMISVAGASLWLGFVLLVRKGYLQELLGGLRQSKFGSQQVELKDEVTRSLELFKKGLRSESTQDVRLMLEVMTPDTAGALTDELVLALSHAEPDIRARALHHLRVSKDPKLSKRLTKALLDPSEDVCSAAIVATREIAPSMAGPLVAPLLDSQPARIRANAAAVVLSDEQASEWGPQASATLEMLGVSPDERDRRALAEALGMLKDPARDPTLVTLLNDPVPSVQRAAISAAVALKGKDAAEWLLPLLGMSRTKRAAAKALTGLGKPAVPALVAALGDSKQRLAVRRELPRILGRIGAVAALRPLFTAMRSTDRRICRDAAWAAGQICIASGTKVPEALVRHQLKMEVHRCVQSATMFVDLDRVVTSAGRDMLADVLQDYVKKNRETILYLLALIYPPEALYSIRASLESADAAQTAIALEALENVLSPSDRASFFPLFEKSMAELGKGSGGQSVKRQGAQTWLREFLASEDDWLVAVALHTVSDLGAPEFAGEVKRLVKHAHPAAREAAANALACLASAEEFAQSCEHLVDDPIAQVRAYVRPMMAVAKASITAVRPKVVTKPAATEPAANAASAKATETPSSPRPRRA